MIVDTGRPELMDVGTITLETYDDGREYVSRAGGWVRIAPVPVGTYRMVVRTSAMTVVRECVEIAGPGRKTIIARLDSGTEEATVKESRALLGDFPGVPPRVPAP
jgi:hypothetical protein